MSNKPEFITFTGVDDDTDPAAMERLSNDYEGRIEWGLLFSPKRQGLDPRYPSVQTIQRHAEELHSKLRYAAHLCGDDAREVIDTGKSRHEHLLRGFQRAQINTADPKVQPSQIGDWAARRNLRAILQCRGEFPQVASVDVLFDASGGSGVVPRDWPVAVHTTFCGFAGGLRPENVADAVSVIGQRAARFWIDMETGIRNDKDRFDVSMCRAVCEAVYGKA